MTDPHSTQLTPLSYLRRSADIYPDRPAVVYGDIAMTYRELADTAETIARGFLETGVRPGDRIAYLTPNIPQALVAQFAVPLAGAILVAINTRLSPTEIAYICDHSGATVLVYDSEYSRRVAELAPELQTVHTLVAITDPAAAPAGEPVASSTPLTELLELGLTSTRELSWSVPDENDVLSINYTSGTTGRPKGVMYTHRGAYLNALGGIVHSTHTDRSVYLWTLPMFHCNGWATGWAVAGAGGTQVCLREVRGEVIWDLIDRHGVTHLNGASTVVNTILNAANAHQLTRRLTVTTGGAPPSPTLISRMSAMGLEIVHVYGLTETYGPMSICVEQQSWDALDADELARRRARQGVAMIQADRLRVVRTDTASDELVDVPADGSTMGEIVMRGNNVMKGYYQDPDGTAKAFTGGWFHSGDLGVLHPDGYIELRDRAKDIIVSGGENISTVEVEQALLSHPAVDEVAVVGVPDDRWGERPKAFVNLRPGQTATASEMREHVTARLARYKAPRDIEIVDELPKTSTGKIQKFVLKDREWEGYRDRVRG
ncbi:long-chain-fatty-acid--CoA ligase [Nocardia asteroides]|uniref:long-chain-fatty-acid--CoA ligase n=1 Tax=Nocardia asteroides TaxID=1824 RepID=UPI003401C8CC